MSNEKTEKKETETNNNESLLKENMKIRMEEAIKVLGGALDADAKKQVGINVATEYATAKIKAAMKAESDRAAINSLTFTERLKLGWPSAAVTAVAVIGGIAVLGALSKHSQDESATDSTASEIGSDANPFATIDTTKAPARNLKSASN